MIIDIFNMKINFLNYGNGRDLILLHGWGGNTKSFEKIIPHLANNFKVWVLDLPGFGESSDPPRCYGILDYVAVLRQFIVKNNITNPLVLGHSFGGRIAIKYASSFGLEKLVLVDSAGIRPKRSPLYYFKVYFYKLLKKLHIKIKAGSNDFQKANDIMRGTLSLVVNEDLKNDMKCISSETLLIWGENDNVTKVKDAKIMEGLITNAGLAIIPNCGHFPYNDNPQFFLLVLDSFILCDNS